uniref:BAR_3_WASP_bdg domain-containing protein n=1 Tax=Heterorhabditis bacteriophora TaxID=37862 RepID=A0A1I7XAS0_HETBA
MEESSQAFKKTVNAVETELSAQMQYLSNVCVGSAHQGMFGELFSQIMYVFCFMCISYIL